MTDKLKEPTYSFAEVPEGVIDPISPIKKVVSKTMEITENFSIFDVMSYIAKMKKAKEDKQAEITGLESMIKAYEDELEVIEKSLGIQKLEEEYQKVLAESFEEKPEDENSSGDKESTS